MKCSAPTKTFAASALVCLGVIVALWLCNIDVVIGQFGDNPDWKVVFVPRAYFLGLYVLEAFAIIIAIWFWRSDRKKPLTKHSG